MKHAPPPEAISAEQMVEMLLSQPGNDAKREERWRERWVQSDRFILTTVHVHMPDLGVTEGKTGRSRSRGPIVVDSNINQVARLQGRYGAAPEFLVLDGQNRVVVARAKGPRTVVEAYVGDRAFEALRRKDDEFTRICTELQETADKYLATPQGAASLVSELKEYTRKGYMTQSELGEIRQQWWARHVGGML